MPHHHWRDAFEDLLAIDSGRGMISAESRKMETVAAANLRFERASESIARVNELLKRDTPALETAGKVRKLANDNGDKGIAASYERKAESMSVQATYRYNYAQYIQADFEDRKGRTGSQHKGRGHWMASLITSGAVKGWYSELNNSEKGESWEVGKLEDEASGDSGGNYMTESEIDDHFEEGIPYEIGSPGPALDERNQGPRTANDQPPIGFHAKNFLKPSRDNVEGITKDRDLRRPSSNFANVSAPLDPAVKSQYMEADRIKHPNGTAGIKALLRTEFMDNTSETKEITDDPVKVLREVEKARASIEDRNIGW